LFVGLVVGLLFAGCFDLFCWVLLFICLLIWIYFICMF